MQAAKIALLLAAPFWLLLAFHRRLALNFCAITQIVICLSFSKRSATVSAFSLHWKDQIHVAWCGHGLSAILSKSPAHLPVRSFYRPHWAMTAPVLMRSSISGRCLSSSAMDHCLAEDHPQEFAVWFWHLIGPSTSYCALPTLQWNILLWKSAFLRVHCPILLRQLTLHTIWAVFLRPTSSVPHWCVNDLISLERLFA